ncbi:MAG: DNA/RNA nuclease SfsA [Thermoprotei archaeon]|nr:MAG: DNA/RNA nuclease SfsA [Thermoprotei archaeon]
MKKVLELPGELIGRFISRPNRFLATVELDGGEVVEVHVHDPGRLKEILRPNSRVLLKRADKEGRRTKYDLLAGEVDGIWVFVHSGYHRDISTYLLQKGVVDGIGRPSTLHPEYRYGKSRMDFMLEVGGEMMLVEVKGCTLARSGVALFPDAPTVRGRRHLEELIRAVKEGMRAAVIFLTFRPDSTCFLPNGETDPDFERTFWRAVDVGVEVYPILLSYDGWWINHLGSLPLCTTPSE